MTLSKEVEVGVVDDDAGEMETVWPTGGHGLREMGQVWQYMACIGWQNGNPYGPIQGYRRAAEIIASQIAERHHEIDLLIFPFGMCWRHHIELRLKDLLADLQELLGRPVVVEPGHNIAKLWDKAKPLIAEAHGEGESADLRNVSRIIGQLTQLDKDGQEFRYNRRRDGRPTLEGVDYIDVSKFHEAMSGVANYLEGVDTATYVALDHKRDMAEYLSFDY
ncbi:hypothetical protein [Micromonospora purpureochromogenes]|uniref:Uncharacterized protein n=1 Tax=Micromonospora purpureochromogenes TaxID=47872 RepID=A0ABX2RQM9_9ACTN|nr:hypothetical protein [Micromonospora purpureochromogenes]NYF58818.1 hypothetical protein [Micromonospora purpureochromogenes]